MKLYSLVIFLFAWLHLVAAEISSSDDDELQADDGWEMQSSANARSAAGSVKSRNLTPQDVIVGKTYDSGFEYEAWYNKMSRAVGQMLGQPTPDFQDFDFSTDHLNLRPIIGILAQEPGRSMRRAMEKKGWHNVTSYIAASYVKSFQSAGAQVVPIMINKQPEYYEMMASSLNGIVFPGGAASITKRSGYGRAGAQLYRLVMDANAIGTVMPLWSTCLGFEMLLHLASGVESNSTGHVLSRCSASNVKDPLHFRREAANSQMFSGMPLRLLAALQTQNVTSNFHKYCVLEETFQELGLDEKFHLLSTTKDIHGLEYISTVEHRDYPVYGTQWHPEKPAYEWRDGLPGIPKTPEAIQVNARLMEMFIDKARHNHNSFESAAAETSYVISNYATFPVQQLYRSSFIEVYFFSDEDHEMASAA